MGDMLNSLKDFVEYAKDDAKRLSWFANQFVGVSILDVWQWVTFTLLTVFPLRLQVARTYNR